MLDCLCYNSQKIITIGGIQLNKQKYKLRFFIEWGGSFLWPDSSDAVTFEKFDVGPLQPEDLNVSKELCDELHNLEKEYQTALNWDYPLDPSPWSEDQFKNFFDRLKIAYKKLCDELNYSYDIAFCMNEDRL